MKKNFFFKLILILFLCLFIENNFCVFARASSYTNFVYARVETSGVYLYKTASSTLLENAYFELPKSWFVLLVSNIDDNFYKAQYKDVVGFVLKGEVSPVAEKPENPYPDDVKFWAYTTDNTNIVSCTFSKDNPRVLGSVTVMEELAFYGEMIGDEQVKNHGYLWLYCKTKTQSGYLYKGLCDFNKALEPNLEKVTKIEDPFLNNDNSFLYNIVDMSPMLKIALVMAVTLPCFLLVFLLFKPFKIVPVTNNKNKPKIKRHENKKRKVKNRTINKIQQIIDDQELWFKRQIKTTT